MLTKPSKFSATTPKQHLQTPSPRTRPESPQIGVLSPLYVLPPRKRAATEFALATLGMACRVNIPLLGWYAHIRTEWWCGRQRDSRSLEEQRRGIFFPGQCPIPPRSAMGPKAPPGSSVHLGGAVSIRVALRFPQSAPSGGRGWTGQAAPSRAAKEMRVPARLLR